MFAGVFFVCSSLFAKDECYYWCSSQGLVDEANSCHCDTNTRMCKIEQQLDEFNELLDLTWGRQIAPMPSCGYAYNLVSNKAQALSAHSRGILYMPAGLKEVPTNVVAIPLARLPPNATGFVNTMGSYLTSLMRMNTWLEPTITTNHQQPNRVLYVASRHGPVLQKAREVLMQLVNDVTKPPVSSLVWENIAVTNFAHNVLRTLNRLLANWWANDTGISQADLLSLIPYLHFVCELIYYYSPSQRLFRVGDHRRRPTYEKARQELIMSNDLLVTLSQYSPEYVSDDGWRFLVPKSFGHSIMLERPLLPTPNQEKRTSRVLRATLGVKEHSLTNLFHIQVEQFVNTINRAYFSISVNSSTCPLKSEVLPEMVMNTLFVSSLLMTTDAESQIFADTVRVFCETMKAHLTAPNRGCTPRPSIVDVIPNNALHWRSYLLRLCGTDQFPVTARIEAAFYVPYRSFYQHHYCCAIILPYGPPPSLWDRVIAALVDIQSIDHFQSSVSGLIPEQMSALFEKLRDRVFDSYDENRENQEKYDKAFGRLLAMLFDDEEDHFSIAIKFIQNRLNHHQTTTTIQSTTTIYSIQEILFANNNSIRNGFYEWFIEGAFELWMNDNASDLLEGLIYVQDRDRNHHYGTTSNLGLQT